MECMCVCIYEPVFLTLIHWKNLEIVDSNNYEHKSIAWLEFHAYIFPWKEPKTFEEIANMWFEMKKVWNQPGIS